ncbi:hypothetical protein D9M68_750340 [compost metagenome]
MRAEDRHRVRGHLGQLFDEHGALRLQVVDDVLVVHDLVAHVDGRAVAPQRVFDRVDGPHDAGAETTGLGKDHAHGVAFVEFVTVAAGLDVGIRRT